MCFPLATRSVSTRPSSANATLKPNISPSKQINATCCELVVQSRVSLISNARLTKFNNQDPVMNFQTRKEGGMVGKYSLLFVSCRWRAGGGALTGLMTLPIGNNAVIFRGCFHSTGHLIFTHSRCRALLCLALQYATVNTCFSVCSGTQVGVCFAPGLCWGGEKKDW